jgi:hypothetical protein
MQSFSSIDSDVVVHCTRWPDIQIICGHTLAPRALRVHRVFDPNRRLWLAALKLAGRLRFKTLA